MEKLLYRYGFRSLSDLQGLVSDFSVETPQELASVYKSHYDVAMPLEDAAELLRAPACLLYDTAPMKRLVSGLKAAPQVILYQDKRQGSNNRAAERSSSEGDTQPLPECITHQISLDTLSVALAAPSRYNTS